MRKLLPVIALALLAATAFPKDKDCHYGSLSGREFVFRNLVGSQEGFGYRWTKKPGKAGLYEDGLSYKKYKPLKGKLLEEIFVKELDFGAEYYFVAVLENCETVYALKRIISMEVAEFNVYDKHSETLQAHHQIVFLDALKREREESTGKVLWINRPALPGDKELFLPGKRKAFPVKNLEKVAVVDFDTTDYGSNRGICPYYAMVRKETGDQGLLPFDPAYYYPEDPIDPSWDAEIVEAILQERPLEGMTVRQVTLALGQPRQSLGESTSGIPRKIWRFGLDLMVVLSEEKVIWQGPNSKMPREFRLPR